MQLDEQLIRVEATIEMQQTDGIKVEVETFTDCSHSGEDHKSSTLGREREGEKKRARELYSS